MSVAQKTITSIESGQLTYFGIWSYLILAILVAVEGPVATLLGAAAASAGFMRPDLAFIASASGNLTADFLWYSLGYSGKIEWVRRFSRWLGIRTHQFEKTQQAIQKHAAKLLLLAKLTAGLMIPSLIAAGLAKISWKRWLPSLLAGEFIWTGGLFLVGFFATQAIQRIEKGIETLIPAATAVGILTLLIFLRKKLRPDQDSPELEK